MIGRNKKQITFLMILNLEATERLAVCKISLMATDSVLKPRILPFSAQPLPTCRAPWLAKLVVLIYCM